MIARSRTRSAWATSWQEALQSEAAAEAMKFDGVRPETILGLVEALRNDPWRPGCHGRVAESQG